LVASNLKDSSGNDVNHNELAKINFKEMPFFTAVMSGQTTDSNKSGLSGTYFEDLKQDQFARAAFGQDKVMTGFSAAIRNSAGEKIGVLTARADEKWVTHIFSDYAKSMLDHGIKNIQAILIDKDGDLLFESAFDAQDGKNEGRFTTNLVKANFEAAVQAVGGQKGAGFMTDFRSGEELVGGYQHIDNPNWVSSVGWSVIVTDSKTDALGPVFQAKEQFYSIFRMATLVALLFSFVFALLLARNLRSMATVLDSNTKQVDDAASKIATHATQLSQAATEQASALQETVAAVEEINSMVEKNAEAASRSIAVSSKSREAAEHGRRIVDEMLAAIQDIDSANSQITEQISTSNREMSEITKLVNDIGSKTKVINEIVFQTKLLSFNASVEAARAGEYGKGFSVVAEEVGNLAQMSGNAAKEITALLEESIRKVESIASSSKVRIDRLAEVAKERVQTGSETARGCNEALEEILRNVQSVDAMVSEIANASKEQSSGIHEISRAISEMENVIQQNSAVAQSSSVAAEQLKGQSTALSQVVDELISYVEGKNRKFAPLPMKRTPANNILEFKKSQKKEVAVPQKEVADEEPVFVNTKIKVDPLKAEKVAELSPDYLKTASGSDAVPSSDDPGFEE
jgi:methyl-accepting chemotaxis protein